MLENRFLNAYKAQTQEVHFKDVDKIEKKKKTSNVAVYEHLLWS